MLKKSILILSSLFILCCFAIPALANQEKLISTVGEATYKVKPDLANVYFLIECENKELNAVQKQNNEIMKNFTQSMISNGVKKSDIQTISFQVTPLQEYKTNSDKRKIIGYRSTQQILLKTNQLDKLGLLTAQALNSGITKIQKISYDLENSSSASQKALSLAVAQAKQKAQTMAKASGITIKGISKIREDNSYINRPNDFLVRISAKADTAETYSETLEIATPELIEVQSRVQMDFNF